MSAYALALLAAGAFFLTALLTGVWKYVEMAGSDQGLAHPYVDIAHRASLMYSFASVLLALFAQLSALPNAVELVATGLVLAYFAMAIAGYVVQGLRKQTDNQMRRAPLPVHVFMWTLIVAEIGGFVVLFYGAACALLASPG